MGGFTQAITQGLGRGGNELATAQLGLRDDRQQQVFQKLKLLQTVLSLAQLKKQIEQMGQPQPYGTVPTQGGGTAGITFQPGKGFGTTPLVPGVDKASVSGQIRAMSAKSQSKEYKTALDGIAQAVDAGLIDPVKAMDEALRLTGTEAGKETQRTPFKFEPEKGIITDKEGTPWSMYDPNLPPDLKALVDAKDRRDQEKEHRKQQDEIFRNELAFKKSLGLLDARDAIKASAQARDAKNISDDVAKNIEAAKRGNSKASLALVFSAVRVMVAGAGRMTNVEIENELRAGSYGQRMQRWYEQATKGVLPEDQMEFIREVVQNKYESTREMGQETWESVFDKKPLPPWLRAQSGTQQTNQGAPPPPPPGYQPEKTP
jgi:hypothetical protein